MSEKSVNGAVSFGERLAGSQAFAELFRDGMALVEQTADYLDGNGLQESKKLVRNAALAYATESMRLTTRLMQLASWLLLHRAVKEGEMSLAQANKEKAKVMLASSDYSDEQNVRLLPERLRKLIERSKARCAGSMPPCTHPPHASIAAIRSSARSACSRRPSSGSDPDKSSWAHAYRARAGRAASPWCRADQPGVCMKKPPRE